VKKTFCLFFLLTTSCQLLNKQQQVGESYYQLKWDQSIQFLHEQKYDEAEASLKELYASAQGENPELATRALFELAQVNEKKGQWTLALAQLKECEIKKNNLPGYKAELELPARIAGLYATLGELQVSETYAQKTESNLEAYKQQISMIQQPSWWAETFYHMGSFPVQYIDADNWMAFAKRFHSTSQYLVRSMELSDPIWSQRSQDLAQTFFKKSLEMITIAPNETDENSVLVGAVIRDRINVLQEIIQKIHLYKPVHLEKTHTAWLFYQSLEDYQTQVKSTLYKIKDSVPMSQESQKRNAIERDGRLVTPDGQLDKKTNDPNL
jgi:hypothetical protein